MADEPVTTPIHNLYAQRFAADLETNRKEQADLTAQIGELEERLSRLKADERWLCGAQGVLPAAGDTAPPVPAPTQTPAKTSTPEQGAVPRPRQAKKSTAGTGRARKATPPKAPSVTAGSGTESKAVARKSTARKPASDKAGANKPVVRKAASDKATVDKPKRIVQAKPSVEAEKTAVKAGKPARTDEPPLRELVHALLVRAAEPRMVSEVAAELTQAHPGRAASGQVVRNTLEGLVKKGQIEKEHRQGSVMYTALQAAAAGPAAEGPVSDAVAEPDTDTATAPAAVPAPASS
ncbi:hypothetical protein ABZ934_00780 [Streptomyces sp. NPDC046557]|uniref:hypothetical protein n=1 Tax=Streptomyces sp. NPDC046557 TaxID=3155372 RepID=UPI0033FA45AD